MIKALSTILLLLALTTLATAQTSEQYLVNSKTLNMRSGAGKEYEVTATLSMGETVTLIEKYDNGWWSVDFDGTQGYVFAQLLKKDPNSGWNKKNYESGETPECENVDPQYDYKLDNYLKINVGSHTDVVIKLMKKQYTGDICVRIVFIRSSETYYLKNIPEGEYYLKIAYGSDWRQKIVDQQCYGKFMRNAQYEIGEERLNYNVIHKNDRDQIPSFELSLDVIVTRGISPTFNSNDISEAEFNK
jgi:hypothetical protein